MPSEREPLPPSIQDVIARLSFLEAELLCAPATCLAVHIKRAYMDKFPDALPEHFTTDSPGGCPNLAE